MATLVDEAIDRLRAQPPEEQERLASLLLDAIAVEEAEDDFDRLIASRPDVLDRLEAAAKAEIAAGLSEPMDLERW
ncbi:MAG: hypothetical protein ACKVVT_09920 [Dehalococcoidia bacterium]